MEQVNRYKSAIKTAAASLVSGLAAGAVVATAMAHDRTHYLHFVAFIAAVAVIVLAILTYRKYLGRREAPVVEETPASEVEHTL